MRFATLFFSFMFIWTSGRSQTWGDSTIKSSDIFYTAQVPPRFPGGLRGYYSFLAENLKPDNHTAGSLLKKTVQVKVYIDKTGRVIYAEIEKPGEANYNCAVLEMVKVMPNWSPALQNNKPVPIAISLPIRFID